MGIFILRGITTALLVTVLTLFAGIVWGVMNLGGLSISRLLDIGLLASCLVGGYRTAKDSGEWMLGGIVGAGYVTVGTLLLALFLPIRGLGFIQVLAEGAMLGLVAGAVGVGGANGTAMNVWSGKRSQYTPSYAGYDTSDGVNSKSDWDQEEEFEEWKEAPTNNWIESSEGKRGIHGVEQNCEKNPDVQWAWNREEAELKGWKEVPITQEIESSEESPDVQWPWNRKEKKLIDQRSGYADPEHFEPLRISTGAHKVSGDRPWWE